MNSWIRGGCQTILLGVFILFMGATIASASAQAKLYGFRMVPQEHVMLHFDLDSSASDADLFMLVNPHRLVIDLPHTVLATELPSETFSQGVVKGIRYSQHGDAYLRVVLDLRFQVVPNYQFVPRQGGQRLVVDLGVKGAAMAAAPNYSSIKQGPLRNAIVAIDAGHGGKDPGAVGQRKTNEKDITLAIALKLYHRLKSQPGVTPVLIRDSDVYVELRERMNIAHQYGADLFISIHADAINRNDAKGSSVYTLSMDGASSEAAAWLAKSENASAALYGDVELDGMDDILRETILSLAQSATMEMSMEAGAAILGELKKIGNVHKPLVEQAAFAVLKSPDIPSVLVETAFLSNRQEEKKLRSARYQDALAKAIERGVVRYLIKRAPEGTHLAAQRRRPG